jgi:hypothetical protein
MNVAVDHSRDAQEPAEEAGLPMAGDRTAVEGDREKYLRVLEKISRQRLGPKEASITCPKSH